MLNVSLMTGFVKENYCVKCAPVFSGKLAAFRINCR
jgi:hypothetical protein